MATPVSGVNRWLTLNGQPLLFDPGSDNLQTGAVEYGTNRLRLTKSAPDQIVIRIDGERLDTEVYGRWDWRPAGFAGLYDLEVSTPKDGPCRTQVRVLPSQLTRQTHELMLKQIAEFSADLLFQLRSPATEWMSAADLEQAQSPLRTYRLVESLMSDLEDAIGQLTRTPHQALVRQNDRRQWHEVVEYSSNVTAIPGPAVALPFEEARLPDVWPLEWQVEHSTLTYDVYENRLIKHFLWRQLLPRLDELEQRAQAEIGRRRVSLTTAKRSNWDDTVKSESKRIRELEQVVLECKKMQRTVIGWGGLSFLKAVSLVPQRMVPTQVLQKHPAYGRFYQIYLRFQRELKRGLNTEGYLTSIAVRKMSELYETWANFRLTGILLLVLGKHGYETLSDKGFFKLDDEFFHFEVDRQAEIVLTRGASEVRIRYEPLYPAENTAREGLVTDRSYFRTPDMAVELWENDRAEAVLLFDPKYRSEGPKGRRTPWAKDIEKMSTYYGEIAWKARGARGRLPLIVSSAYVVYPGDTLKHDPQHPNVGALPLVPGSRQQVDVTVTLIDLLKYAGIL